MKSSDEEDLLVAGPQAYVRTYVHRNSDHGQPVRFSFVLHLRYAHVHVFVRCHSVRMSF